MKSFGWILIILMAASPAWAAGVLLGQVVGWLRDHGYSYTPALVISGSLHLAGFALICLVIPNLQKLKFN